MNNVTESNGANTRAYRIGTVLVAVFLFSFVLLYVGVPGFGDLRYQGAALPIATSTGEAIIEEPVAHVATPEVVKGIYMTSCVASAPSIRNGLVKLIEDTELNAVVIDIKSFDGRLSFEPKDESLKNAAGGCLVKDMKEFIKMLHEKNIYVIGRLAAFQDEYHVGQRPDLAVKKASATTTVWRDYKGISWIDASSKEHWEYIIAIARESYGIGFDEINFDYIRFPADGNMKDIFYPMSGNKKKSEVMLSFFEYVNSELSSEMTISADLFGMTTTNFDDLNIGQVLEHALLNFDYVSPMVYPSHYPYNFMGLGNPNDKVYEVVKISMAKAVERAVATTTSIELPGQRIGTSTPAVYAKPSIDRNKLRPWLQDNNYPVPYTAEMVRAQIQATYDVGLDSWMLWNAGNRYTRAALNEDPLTVPLGR